MLLIYHLIQLQLLYDLLLLLLDQHIIKVFEGLAYTYSFTVQKTNHLLN